MNERANHHLHWFGQHRCGARRHGFTLAEIAIIVSVIGLVLAALFVTAQAVQYRNQINQGLDEINQIVGNMRSLYAGRNASGAPQQPFSQGFEQQMANVTTGVFPSEMACTIGGATYACNPWDQSQSWGSAQVEVNTPVVGQFVIRYYNIPPNVCADLLVRNSLPGSDTGLQQIVVSTSATPLTLPVTPLAAATACPAVAGAVYNIDWYYSLGS